MQREDIVYVKSDDTLFQEYIHVFVAKCSSEIIFLDKCWFIGYLNRIKLYLHFFFIVGLFSL